MNQNAQAYPLTWPLGWPRAPFRQESRFRKPHSNSTPGAYNRRRHTIDEARRKLFDELERLGAKEVVLSTNLILRLDGYPNGGQAQPGDTGVAVYFKLKGKPIVLPCDKWTHVECNIWAVACHIESLRGQDRWGVGTVERAFDGYLALPQQTQAKWFETLGVAETATREEIDAARRGLLKRFHPNGSEPDEVKFFAVGEAYRIAMELRGSR